MIPARRILDVFVKDLWVLSGKALARVSSLIDQDHATGEDVREIFQWIHTIKGSACMIPEARSVVDALQGVEGRLAVRSVEESARLLVDWAEEARRALELARREAERIRVGLVRGGYRFADEQPGAGLKGSTPGLSFLLLSGQKSWVSMDEVLRVLSPTELSGRRAILEGGRWVPVQGGTPHPFAYGIIVKSSDETWVVQARQIIGVETWNQIESLAA